MSGVKEEVKKKKELNVSAAAQVVENLVAVPVLAEQQNVEQGNLRQEITEVLPMYDRIPQLPLALQRVAEPMPEQPVPPEKMTYKKRRKMRKQDQEAKKRCPYADHVSLAIEKQLSELTIEKKASNATDKGEAARAEGKTIDGRELVSFITGYKQDKEGNPLNEQEADKKQKDQQFLEDYTSCDLQRRLPHLERMKNEMLQMQLSPDMLTEAYLEKHVTEVYNIISKLTYFEGVQKDPINAPYFEQLPEVEKKLIQYRTTDLCVEFCGLWFAILGTKGITLRDSEVSFVQNQGFRDNYAKMEPLLRQQLKERCAETRRKEEELRQEALMQSKQQGIIQFNQAVRDCLPDSDLRGEIGGADAEQELYTVLREKETPIETENGRKMFQGRIALSDAMYESGNSSRALLLLGFRQSALDAAQANKKLRGNFFDPLEKEYVSMFRNLADAGVNFEEIARQMEKKPCSDLKYISGGGTEQIFNKQFELFSRYIYAPQGKEYIAKLFSQLKDAKVFEGQKEKCVDFILLGLLNTNGANYVKVSGDSAYYGEHADAVKSVCLECCRTLLTLSRAHRLPEEEVGSLTPEMQQLLAKYREMIRTVCEGLVLPEEVNQPGQA